MKAFTQKSLLAVLAVATASGIAYAAPVDIAFDGIVSASGSTGVTVNATVAPILTFDVSATTLNLGALTSAGYSAQTLNLEVATNANGGATVTAASANGGLKGTAASGNHVINDQDATLADQSYQIGSVKTANTADLRTGSTRSDLALEEINSTAAKTVYDVTGPERADATADAVVTIQAQADDATPADTYQDVVTLTVTATF